MKLASQSGGEGGGGRPVEGIVVETMPSALYRVRLDEGSSVLAHIADRMDRNFVRVIVGDRVRIELFDAHGHSVFGAIDQVVEKYTPPEEA